ncbi:DUF4124 domain-containing protein [uncultured Gilvimarinus sp.]|uniref:DUF4124 domain-containing protein n=1 Tax=uncultured Gilvimarinus sp. TaxID=1689143 RepID=UPI0030ECE2DC|tara:strand:- start:1912 stop:3093 length:1182 start_codon:yes stop_codon:yes gene_type:complete
MRRGAGLLLGVYAALVAGMVQAQVYSWTDSNGRVHYSDQPTDQNAVLQSLDIGTMPAPKLVKLTTPRLLRGALYPLVMSPFGYSDAVFSATKPAARFYFGGDCVSPTSLRFNELRQALPTLVRTPEQLQVDAFRAIRRLGHTHLYRAGHYGGPVVDSEQVRYLSGEVIDLDLAGCFSQGASAFSAAELPESMLSRFKMANAWIKVRWQLRRSPGATPLLSFETEGSAATQLTPEVTLLSAMRESFSAAAANALSDSRLRQALLADDPDNQEPPPQADANQQLMRQANFAAALSELSAVKVMVAEYYQIRGVMPLSMTAIGLGAEQLQHSRYISSLRMQAPGVIHAELNVGAFSAGHFVELIPKVSQGFTLIEWRCETSLDTQLSACPAIGTAP